MGLVIGLKTGLMATGKNVTMAIHDSSYLMEAQYDANSNQLTVTMKGGGQYVYSQVTADVMQDFQEARSKSEFYAHEIREKFPSNRIVAKTVGKKTKAQTKKGR